jgi:hypothetical protein
MDKSPFASCAMSLCGAGPAARERQDQRQAQHHFLTSRAAGEGARATFKSPPPVKLTAEGLRPNTACRSNLA